MSVSVILIGYHGDRWLPACIDSLAAASAERLHLVLVDNTGNTCLDELDLLFFEPEVLTTPRPMGFAEANNFALVEASSLREHVLFLNQDTVSPAGWIDACLDSFEQDSLLGAVSPLIRTYDDDGWDPSFLDCLGDEAASSLDASEQAQGEVISVQNAPAPALLVRTDVLRQTGPFDPVFGSYYEDYDLCRRIRALGHKIGFCRDVRIRHFSGGSTTTAEQERRRMRQIIRNRTVYQLRESDAPRWKGTADRVLLDFPRRLARGLAGTPSSQPPVVTLQAYFDLLRISRRLVSRTHDERQWQAYLDELGWPPDDAVVVE